MTSIPIRIPQRRTFLVAIMVLLSHGILNGQDLRLSQSTDLVMRQSIVVPAGMLTTQRAEELGREFLSGPARPKMLAELSMATNVPDLSKLDFHGPPPTESGGDYNYTNALAELKMGFPFSGPVARVLKFGDRALLDFRGDPGTFTEISLTGTQNDSILGGYSSAYQLLKFLFTGTKVLSLEMFLKVSPVLSVRDASELTLKLLKELDVRSSIVATFRTDTWFLDSIHFPLLFPFAADISPPFGYQYLSAPFLFCRVEPNGPVECNGRNFRP